MHVFRSLGHDDPLFGVQPAAAEWRLNDMHAAATGRDVRVAVVDSGVQLDHPDLVGQVVGHASFAGDREERAETHGTAVAGIVAARADNHLGIAGVAPEARLLALRACREVSARETTCSTLGLALALHAAIDRSAQVINLSLGGPFDRLIEQLVGAALTRGIPVVAAADRTLSAGGFPASVPGVLAVVDENGGADAGRDGRRAGHRCPVHASGISLGHGLWSVVCGGACERNARAHDRRPGTDPWPVFFSAVQDRRRQRRADRFLRESRSGRSGVRVQLHAVHHRSQDRSRRELPLPYRLTGWCRRLAGVIALATLATTAQAQVRAASVSIRTIAIAAFR